ncbi:MAG: enoyl-CoA hydratase/isomerase family protein [Planctomycetota bacterium]
MLERTERNGVTTLRLAHGKVHALDLELLQALSTALREEATSGGRALLLTGTGRSFCAGVDLARLLDGGAAYIAPFLAALAEVLDTLFHLPKPVIAAVNGHAIAGGCVLALACDVVLMAEGPGQIGAPELAVGVPFPPLALEVLRARLTPAVLTRVVVRSETFGAEDALRLGLVDELVASEELTARAASVAETLASVPSASFALTKALLREPSRERVRRQDAAVGATQAAVWSSPDVLGAVQKRLAALKRP